MTGEKLRALRARMGLTQWQLAALLNVHQITVSSWERGTRKQPREWHREVLALLAQARSFDGLPRTFRQEGPVVALTCALMDGLNGHDFDPQAGRPWTRPGQVPEEG